MEDLKYRWYGEGASVKQFWIWLPRNSGIGVEGWIKVITLSGEIRLSRRVGKMLYLMGDVVYSLHRLWRVVVHGDLIHVVPFGRLWKWEFPWDGNFTRLPEGEILVLNLKKWATPEEFNQEDEFYRGPLDRPCPPAAVLPPPMAWFRRRECPGWGASPVAVPPGPARLRGRVPRWLVFLPLGLGWCSLAWFHSQGAPVFLGLLAMVSSSPHLTAVPPM